MSEFRLQSGSNKLLRASILSTVYEDVLSILGSGGIILPIGDPILSKLDASTFTTVRNSSSGVESTWTWSEAPKDFDVPPATRGIVPIVDFNGTDEQADTPDADYYSFGADGTAPNEPTFSLGLWVRPDDVSANAVFLSKFDSGNEYVFFSDTSATLRFRIFDDSTGGRIGRASASNELIANQWQLIVATYDASAADSGCTVYRNASAVDTTNQASGSYTAMENLTGLPKFGEAFSDFINGSVAGGPIGPFFTDKELTAAEVKRLYHLGARLLGVV